MGRKEETIQFWMLNIASFLGQLTISMVNLSLVYHLRYTLGTSATVVGLAASTYMVVYLLGNILLGRFYQRFKPNRIVCISLVGMGLSALMISVASSVAAAFSLIVLYGFFMSMLWPQMESWITRGAENARLNRLTSAFNFSWSFGTGISPYITSFLVAFSPAVALFSACIIFVVTVLMITVTIFLVPSLRISPEHEYMVKAQKEEGKVDHSTPLRFDSWFAVFVVYSALSVVLTIFPMYAGEQAGMSETTSGFLLLLRGLATCAAFMTLGRMKFWQFKAWMIFLAEALFIVLALAFHSASTVLSIGVFFILFGILFALCYSFSIFHSAAGAIDRGRRMVIHECVLTVGQMIGASFGGVIYQKLGYSNVLIFLAIVATVLLLIQLIAFALRKSRDMV